MPAFVQHATLRLWSRLAAVTALAGAAFGAGALAQEPVYDEASVKAAFIYHFSTFVIWPDSAPHDQDFVIAVLGDESVTEELRTYLPGHSIQGRGMKVRAIDSIDAFENEAVLFIGAERNDELDRYLAALADEPVLIVTDAPGALEKGSMINFKIVDRRVRFEISLRAAERAGLVLSSRLLSAAMFVDTTSAILDLPPVSIVALPRAGR